MPLVLDGSGLTIGQLVQAARDPAITVEAAPAALERVRICRAVVDQAVADYLAAKTDDEHQRKAVYGVTTGFGEFKNILLDKNTLKLIQENILKSHSVGFGVNENIDDPANYYSADLVRAAIVLRINTFLKGHSGVRIELIQILLSMLNDGIIPLVPLRGSLGSSGDLCPLAHTFVILLGEGYYYPVKSKSDLERGLLGTSKKPAQELLKTIPIKDFRLAEKEGIALTNGAVYSAAMLAFAVHEAEHLAAVADGACALALEAIQGRLRAFDAKIHEARGMAGQIESARIIRELVKGSKLVGARSDVQDVYSVRCAPQVHGASRDAIAYARKVAELEMNAATDNPLFFPGHAPDDADRHEPLAFSAGNFHGQPVGLAADFLAIAVAELANISERRTQMLLDKNHNHGLPANLIADGGLNTGLMIAQYTAASLVSENKIFCHPASVDSIPSSANIEDHVAMATTAARKLGQILANTKAVLAIELMCAAQAVEWRLLKDQSRQEFERVFVADPGVGKKMIHDSLGSGTKKIYNQFRQTVKPIIIDEYLESKFMDARRAIEVFTINTN